MNEETLKALRNDLNDCFRAQRMAQILDDDDRDTLEAAFVDRLDMLFSGYKSLHEALSITHGTAQAMADLDSWIAMECGMVDDGENYYVPAAREALGVDE